MKFTIECEMKDRWVPYFLGMLKQMQYFGAIGSSREIKFYSDGDGDYRPKFKWDDKLPVTDPTLLEQEGGLDIYFDAG